MRNSSVAVALTPAGSLALEQACNTCALHLVYLPFPPPRFQLPAPRHNAGENTYVTQFSCTFMIISLEYIPISRISRPKCMQNILKLLIRVPRLLEMLVHKL